MRSTVPAAVSAAGTPVAGYPCVAAALRRRAELPWCRWARLATGLALGAWLAGCASLHHYAVNRLGDALATSGSGFAGDDDPELIRAAAPFSLKLMESLLQEAPEHAGLLTATAAGFTEYAYAFVQQDADELEGHDLAASLELRRRARGLYLRARDYGMRALETRHPKLRENLRRSAGSVVAELGPVDAPSVYWTAAAWAASISLDKDSADAVADLPQIDAMLARLESIDADYDHGALDTLLMSYESGRPGAHDLQRAVRRHFERAVRLSDGQKAAPYVAFAETVCVRKQDRAEFVATLQQALAIDPAQRREWRLENRVMQRRARWLLTQVDQLFLE